MKRFFFCTIIALAALTFAPLCAFAQTGNADALCPRPAPGSVVMPPPDLYSHNGVLNVNFNYYTTVDSVGRTLFCFVTPDGLESPTLHVNPGDTMNVTVTNMVPAPPPGSPEEYVSNSSTPPADDCGVDMFMTITAVNVHYHGTNTSPACDGDQVIHTVINSGETFTYTLTFPTTEPPGVYWYHPHIYGFAEPAVLGGGTGAIIVEGIEKLQPAVAGLPERLLVLRDLNVPGLPAEAPSNSGPGSVPGWDVSVNYVEIGPYPATTPAIIQMQGNQQEFWRVVNAAADTNLDVQLQYDGVPQPLQVVSLDGVPVGSQDGTAQGKIITATDILLATANRAEFIVTPPGPGVKNAAFVTLNVDTGPDGDNDPPRTLATVQTTPFPPAMPVMPSPSGPPNPQLFAGLGNVPVTAHRTLYFSEVLSNPSNPASPTNFYITVDGATPQLFDPLNPPAIITTQGSVEDWTIENQAQENHEFHLHQVHFQVLSENYTPQVPLEQGQFLDTVQVPYWSGTGPYPSVTVRMDFRGADIGDFVYHCHILGHEDAGMMAIIRVLPPPT